MLKALRSSRKVTYRTERGVPVKYVYKDMDKVKDCKLRDTSGGESGRRLGSTTPPRQRYMDG
jgi:hypothetical protein